MSARTTSTIRHLALVASLALAAALLDAGNRAATAAEEAPGEVTTLEAGTTAYGAAVRTVTGQTYQQSLATSEQRYGGRLGVVRYFDKNYPDSWTSYTRLMGSRDVNLSFRISPNYVNGGGADSYLRSWFANAPTDRTIYWTYMHEPENDIQRGSYTAAAFRTAWARIAALAREANKPNLRATLVLMCWTVEPASRRSWTDYYSPGDVDVLGWDCFNGGWRKGIYADPLNIFPRPIAASRAAGLPWAISELGSIRVPTDTTGEGRAAWITRSAQYLHAEGAEFVAWFDTIDGTSDFRLTDEPSRQAWFDAVSDQDPFPPPTEPTPTP
jgi:hypothetical protein